MSLKFETHVKDSEIEKQNYVQLYWKILLLNVITFISNSEHNGIINMHSDLGQITYLVVEGKLTVEWQLLATMQTLRSLICLS